MRITRAASGPAGAYVPLTRQVAGHALSADVTLVKGDVGLGNVDNTADSAKPVSTAQQTALNAKADLVGGLVPTSQIPALALTTAVTVASQAAMLALTTTQVQPGDVAVRTDGAGTFILTATDPSVLGNWTRLNAPTDAVTTVNGQTGTVVLAKADVGLGSVDNTADTAKPVSTLQQTALDAKISVVEHGATAGTARPSTATRVFWRGSVQPTNAVQYDRWINTSTSPYSESIYTGSAWTSLSASRTGARRVKTGQFYPLPGLSSSFAQSALTLNSLCAYPFIVDNGATLTAIKCAIGTNVPSALVRLGIYADDGNGKPDVLLLDAGTVDASGGGGAVLNVTTSLALTTDTLFWLAWVAQGAAANMLVYAAAQSNAPGAPVPAGISTPSSNFSPGVVSATSTSGALPAAFGTLTSGTQNVLKVLLGF